MKNAKTLDKILTVILIIAIITAAALTIYVIITPKKGEEFTEFYILGEGGNASNYPSSLSAGEEGTVIVGVVNHEYEPISYLFRAEIENKTFGEKEIQLAHNETVEFPFTFTARKGITYLFGWDEVPGNDSERLLSYLRADHDLDWVEGAEIIKSADRKTIYVIKDENLSRITMNGEKATLKTRGGGTFDLKVKRENGNLNVYGTRKLKFLLFKGNSSKSGNDGMNINRTAPYRELHLWIDFR
jgi:uncharacterized membrane protein